MKRAICQFGAVVVTFMSIHASQTFADEPPADLVLRGGKIVTVDDRRPIAEALAARGDRIIAVGSDAEITKLIGPPTNVIDLAGKLAIPGFIEGHGHFTALGQSRMMLDLKRARSWDEIIALVAEAARKAEPGEWIVGRGWHQEKWTTRPEPNVAGYPAHDRLSGLTPKNPVLLTHASGHMSFANAEAMRLAGVDSSTQDPPGGEVLKDQQENPIGVFRETAQALISRAMSASSGAGQPRPGSGDSRSNVRRAIDLAMDECLANGVTSFQDAGSTFGTIDVFKDLAASGQLKLRLWVMVRDSNETMARRLADYRMIGAGDNHLTVRAIKRAIDGALGPHGAWLLEPYHDLPESAGLNTSSIESIRETAGLAVKHDYQLCVHAIGDRANREVLNLFEEVSREKPTQESRRWRIEHAQHLHPSDIPRFARLGVIASMQGIHCTSDAVYVRERLGPERAREGAYVWQSLMKSGAVVTNGTDVPVEDISPIESFYATVTRKLADGSTFYPEQRMTRPQALRSYTLNCAYAAFEEDLKGSLERGKLADVTVLSKDIMTAPDDEILSTKVLMTVVGGKVLYERPGEELRQRPGNAGSGAGGAVGQSRNQSNSVTQGYQRPPQAILDILDSPPTPAVSISPTREHLLLVERTSYPVIADLAAPMLRLAGRRINPETNGPHLAPLNVGLLLQSLADNAERRIELPKNARVGSPSWSPAGRHIAFTITTDGAIELWVANVADASAQRIAGVRLNAAYGESMQWMPDGRALLVQTVAPDRGNPPVRPRTPAGPTIEESAGRAGPIRTYQDLLQDAHDEALFDFYCTSQLAIVDITTGRLNRVGQPALIASVEPSPDGNHLLVIRNLRPYSYVLPAERFPKQVEVWDRSGRVEFQVASLPLEDRIPIEGVPTGPRSVDWRPTEPATLVWAEALDGGDPRTKVPHRDRILMLAAPFQSNPTEIMKAEQRFAGLTWGERDRPALLRDYDRDRRWTRTFQLNVDRPDEPAQLIWERSINDRYADPGSPVMRPLPNGRRVIWQHGSSIFLEGAGATPQGDRPFLDHFDLATRKTERMFQCDDSSYETVIALLSDDGSRFITHCETPTDPPNYFVRAADATRQRLTNFPDPMPQLRSIHKELVTYRRDDGVQLSFTLYLPPGHQPGQLLPTVLWAYPREFNDPGTAGQVSGSTNRFTTIGGISHLFFLMQGYAILDNATMPVVGDPETANNTYVEQIVSSARAAIDTASAMGVTDRNRVGVGGHSYGAFMTANLLAHSDLFRAGIARSGAYNRTLTPFGFQSERRTFWEAPEVYLKMSPFAVAHRINEPILLIHGEADNNPGTFPIQSERLYQAIRGNGGTVRYVTLPHESHGYVARESVEHTLWEMITWFDRHVKNASDNAVSARRSDESR